MPPPVAPLKQPSISASIQKTVARALLRPYMAQGELFPLVAPVTGSDPRNREAPVVATCASSMPDDSMNRRAFCLREAAL